MSAVTAHAYGKAAIRVLLLERPPRDLTVAITVPDGPVESFTEGDNGRTVTTNTLATLATGAIAARPEATVERLAAAVSASVTERYPHLGVLDVEVREAPWAAIDDSRRAFTRSKPRGTWARSEGTTTTSGLDDLEVISLAGHQFTGFVVDELTPDPETLERPIAGHLHARWTTAGDLPGGQVRAAVQAALTGTLAQASSRSVQHLVHQLASAALAAAPVASVTVRLDSTPLVPVGPTWPGVVAVQPDPHGTTEVCVARRPASPAFSLHPEESR